MLVAVAAVVGIATGCERQTNRPVGGSQSLQQRADRGEVLLKAAVTQWRDLPAYVDTQLTPARVILDSTKSSDGEDVLAVCTLNPNVPEGIINYVQAPNSRFRSLGVRPGDVLKYFVLVDEQSQEIGFAQAVAIDLVVAQVLSDDTLLIEGGLPQQVLEPAKIEVWRYVDDRLNEISRQFLRYINRLPPAIGWEPSPDQHVLEQIVMRLNQWLRQSQVDAEWQLDPLLATLDDALASDERLVPHVAKESLEKLAFNSSDGRLLQEAMWVRDISRWAQGDEFDDLSRARALFDWTIRNVQLDADSAAAARRPWQVLLHGHGSAEQRAWIFALLARQQGLDVVTLYLPIEPAAGTADAEGTEGTDAPDDAAGGAEPRGEHFWLPALVHEGQLYLFDARLGLPVPGPEGEGVATLADVRENAALLRQLDLDDSPYGVSSAALDSLTIRIVADPFDLTRRAGVLESKLAGDDKLNLSAAPSALAERVAGAAGAAGADIRLWEYPFRTLREQLVIARSTRRQEERRREAMAFEPFAWRPVLWKARVLHFQGREEAPTSAAPVAAASEPVDDHRQAAQLYMDRSVRPADRELSMIAAADKRRVYAAAKLNAGYWLGVMLYDDGRHAAAAHWLSRPELTADGSPWAAGARYNLARTHEALGQTDEAIALYEADDSPQRHGNRLRARQLRAAP